MANMYQVRRAAAVGAVSLVACLVNPQYQSIDDIMPQNFPTVIRNADFKHQSVTSAPNLYTISYSALYASALGLFLGLIASPSRRRE